MSATDALTITSALDALTRYYDAKEREENAVLYINDAYLEALNSLEKLEVENAKLRELCAGLLTGYECGYGELCKGCTWDGIGDSKTFSCLPRAKARDLGVEVGA